MNSKQNVSSGSADTSRICWALVIVGLGISIAGFIVPPLGVIDNSVIVYCGLILTTVCAMLGINTHYSSIIDKLINEKNGKVPDPPDKHAG